MVLTYLKFLRVSDIFGTLCRKFERKKKKISKVLMKWEDGREIGIVGISLIISTYFKFFDPFPEINNRNNGVRV